MLLPVQEVLSRESIMMVMMTRIVFHKILTLKITKTRIMNIIAVDSDDSCNYLDVLIFHDSSGYHVPL